MKILKTNVNLILKYSSTIVKNILKVFIIQNLLCYLYMVTKISTLNFQKN